MTRSALLRGYRYSVYNRIARIALHEKGVAYDVEEVDPFLDEIPDDHSSDSLSALYLSLATARSISTKLQRSFAM